MPAGLLLVNLLVYAISAYYVAVYYMNNPPHFDSIGSLTLMYDYINRFYREGAWEAWMYALKFDSVSWVQGTFAVVLAPVLPRTPMAMMSLNFGLLYLSQLAMFDLGKQFGASRLQAFAFGLLPLLPDALHSHYGGYQDMRRDASFFSLLLTTYCLSLTYVRRPTLWHGAALGLAAGLATWARGNAPPYMIIALAPAVVWGWLRGQPKRQAGDALRLAAVPVLVASAFAGPYYYDELGSVLDKYLFDTPDLNTSRWASFLHFGPAPIVLMLGEPGRLLVLKLIAVFVGLPALAAAGIRLRALDWQPRTAFEGPRRWLWIGGVVVIAGTVVLVTLVVGVSSIAGYPTAFSVLIGMLTLILAASLAVRWQGERATRHLLRLLSAALVLLATLAGLTDKLRLSTYPRQTENVQTAYALIPVLRELAYGRRVTWLWDGNLNYWVINYYLTQAGAAPIEGYYPVNLSQPPSPILGETVESRLEEIRTMLLSTDVLIISDSPTAYTGRMGPGLFENYGYRLEPEVVANPQLEQVYELESDGYHFVILKRKEAG
jgi:hypothetical protein